ncbi:hypothetical protein NPIL_39511 [Nephila pilipes]|uniref:Uncharacterized protein n=1 Tax=Nephila pilipes TaxID=299642 RepID=A0A8X6QVI8_NEPPI|nr:hypothetical protein NPIL_39511 [Nephila pilipes]
MRLTPLISKKRNSAILTSANIVLDDALTNTLAHLGFSIFPGVVPRRSLPIVSWEGMRMRFPVASCKKCVNAEKTVGSVAFHGPPTPFDEHDTGLRFLMRPGSWRPTRS